MKRFALLASAALLFSISSCKKDDNNPECATTQTSMAGTYKIISASTSIDNGTPIDEPACLLDNQVVLNADGTSMVNYLGEKCDDNEPTQDSGTWSYTNEGFKLGEDLYKLESFDCKRLVFSDTYTEGGHTYYEKTVLERITLVP